jgi:hypothetical protein
MANFIANISWVKNLFRTIKIMCMVKLHMIVKWMPGIVAAPHSASSGEETTARKRAFLTAPTLCKNDAAENVANCRTHSCALAGKMPANE